MDSLASRRFGPKSLARGDRNLAATVGPRGLWLFAMVEGIGITTIGVIALHATARPAGSTREYGTT